MYKFTKEETEIEEETEVEEIEEEEEEEEKAETYVDACLADEITELWKKGYRFFGGK